jgi:hypothetical protein
MSKSKQTGIPVMVVIQRKGETFEPLSDQRVVARMRWFLPGNAKADSKLAKALNADGDTAVAFLNARGEVLARVGPKDSSSVLLKHLKEIGATSRADFLAKLKDAETPEVTLKTSVDGLLRMGGSAREVMPLLIHKSTSVKTAVGKALPTLPPDDVALAALDGLASDDAEMRAACYRWATTTAKAPKTPPLKFWKEAEEEERKQALTKWREAVMPELALVNREVIEFAEAHMGKQVGSGECSILALEALNAAEAKSFTPMGETYIWGREVKAGQKVLPGDIVQIENAKFSDGLSIKHHTMVIRKLLGPNRYEILECNVSGRKTVGTAQLEMNKLTEGSVKIYRPQPK